jgi:hypothetical protein
MMTILLKCAIFTGKDKLGKNIYKVMDIGVALFFFFFFGGGATGV